MRVELTYAVPSCGIKVCYGKTLILVPSCARHAASLCAPSNRYGEYVIVWLCIRSAAYSYESCVLCTRRVEPAILLLHTVYE